MTKTNGDDNDLESLIKITQSAIERYLKEKKYPLDIIHSKKFRNSKEMDRRITLAAISNPFSKDN